MPKIGLYNLKHPDHFFLSLLGSFFFSLGVISKNIQAPLEFCLEVYASVHRSIHMCVNSVSAIISLPHIPLGQLELDPILVTNSLCDLSVIGSTKVSILPIENHCDVRFVENHVKICRNHVKFFAYD